jgi:ATP-dependent RNA helicase SUPV3L1/SUV3
MSVSWNASSTDEVNISKSGEVVVEGHAIGRLDGFMFTPEMSGAGSDAKALAGAAQKALAGEIGARANRLAHAADGQLVLSTEDIVRWLGQPVARLVPGEEPLKPRLRLLCDEHLEGAPREAVQARLELWLKTHIERILEPLFRLAAAEDITGMARGLAYQLIEAMGVLERQKVTDEVKGLDQAARATLRKYGVRFGAYHIYLPSLLKPAARVLATQLWALKSVSPEAKGVAAVEQAAGSGRTSISVQKEEPKSLYRVGGYRVCGERAVRVDILERLADLIRASLAWRPGAGEKPAGAIEGFGFTVSPAMTSLAGCSGEDFASVLRSLGYRMEKRPRMPEAAIAARAAGEPEGSTAPIGTTSGEPAVVASLSSDHVQVETSGGSGGSGDELTLSSPQEETETDRERAAAAPSVDLSPTMAAVAQSTTAEFIEVWRPGHKRPPDDSTRRHRIRRRSTAKPNETPAADVKADVAPLVPGQEAPAPVQGTHRRRPRRTARESDPQASEQREAPKPRSQRDDSRVAERQVERQAHQKSRDRPDRGHKGDRPDRDPGLRARYIKGRGEQKPAHQPDPDSPFAKLAKLKEQLEADAKEQR